MNGAIVKEIIDPFKKEEKLNPIEINLYSKLINKKVVKSDDNEIAKDLYDQLIDVKDNIDKK